MTADITTARASVWSVRDVPFGAIRYPYHLGYDCIDRIAWNLGRYGTDRFLVVSDDTVMALHSEPLLTELTRYAPAEPLSLPAGEEIKTLTMLTGHLERAVELGASRRSVVVGFGGGVPGNLAGLVAGLLFRGVRLVHIPTTTVAAMDSTISLKQAVNGRRGKNHFGLYHAPEAVFTDVKLLQTLPERDIRSGLCEATKNCLAIRPEAIPALRAVLAAGTCNNAEALLWLLEESLAAKTLVTASDAKEQGTGLVLEYGHTVGHAIEICDHRRRRAAGISHGESVAIGMRAAARVSAAMGGLTADGVALHDDLISALGVPVHRPSDVAISDVMTAVRADNKRGYIELTDAQAAMVLLREPGVVLGDPGIPLSPVDLGLLEAVIAELG